jgi:hypothetical protein
MSEIADETTERNKTGAGQPIAFAEFLQSTPPSIEMTILDLFEDAPGPLKALHTPQLLLHCDSAICAGVRTHRRVDDAPSFKADMVQIRNVFIEYICSNCREKRKYFALHIKSLGANTKNPGRAYKFGENPPFGPKTPPRLITLLGDQWPIFLKGRRCEFQGLGVGAFSYYRRVVEHQKGRILDEIIRVSERIGVEVAVIDVLKTARSETQFSKSLSMVKNAIPQALLINGHNPLTLLHSALSDGLHDRTDEHCLELAHDIRIVLADLSERLSQALKDEAELNTAVSRLMKVKE